MFQPASFNHDVAHEMRIDRILDQVILPRAHIHHVRDDRSPGKFNCQVIRGDAFDVVPSWPRGSVDLVVTDPPYGKGHQWWDDWSARDYDRLSELIEHVLKPGGTAYVWGCTGGYRHRIFFDWLARLEHTSKRLRIHNVITWRKRRAGEGVRRGYLNAREECVMIVNGRHPKTFHTPYLPEKRTFVHASKDGKHIARSEWLRRTTVWSDVTEMMAHKIHPTEKPARLAEIMIKASSNVDDVVADFFAGSGSVAVAARRLKRRVVLVEKSDCKMHVRTE
jgi:site-specific DNA-methyltransferase (adenine-specific)